MKYKDKLQKIFSIILVISVMVSSIAFSAYADEEETINTETTEETIIETSVNEPEEEKQTTFITFACDAEEFIDDVSILSNDNRIVVNTTINIEEKIDNAFGVYFDGTYVLSFADEDSLNSAVKYFDSKDISYALEGTMSLCGTADETADIQINKNATTRVAVIDTGSDIANESYSVIDDSTRDYNGHGTKVVSNILSYTDDAYIISIKAINSNGRGTMTDVCAALNYALNSDVDVIVMCISIYDTGDYDGFKDLVNQATKNGITVISSAGNNNKDAKKYTPANIDKVITVGALNEDLTKADKSNYGDLVDYYVVSNSTSNAASIFAGKYVAKNLDGTYKTYKSATENVTPTPTQEIEKEVTEFNINDGWHEYDDSIPDGQITWLTEDELRSLGYSNDNDFREAVIYACKQMLGGAYGSSTNGWMDGHTDCITMTTRAYAQALGLISNLHTVEGCEHGLHVEYDVTPGAIEDVDFGSSGGYKVKQASKRYGISVQNGQDAVYLFVGRTSCDFPREVEPVHVEKTVAETLKQLNAKKGDIVLWATINKDGQYSWKHANVYAGTGVWFYDSYQSASPIEYRERPNTPNPIGSNKWNAIAVLHVPAFDCSDEDNDTKISIADQTPVLTCERYIYDGKSHKPGVSIEGLLNGVDYRVSYPSDTTKVGYKTLTVIGIGKHTGTIKVTYKISPKKISIKKIYSQYKGFSVTWSTLSVQVSGYQIQYSTSSTFSNAKKVTVSYKSGYKRIYNLKRNKKYYVRVRSYKTVNGIKFYSDWSSVKTIKTR